MILTITGLAGKICYSQRSMSVFPNVRAKGDSMSPGLPRSLLFCARGRNHCITERAEVTKLLFGKSIGKSTILLRDLYTARWSYVKKLALDLQENENPKPFWNFVKSKRRGTNDRISFIYLFTQL